MRKTEEAKLREVEQVSFDKQIYEVTLDNTSAVSRAKKRSKNVRKARKVTWDPFFFAYLSRALALDVVLKYLRLEQANKRQVAIVLSEIQPVTDDEAVR